MASSESPRNGKGQKTGKKLPKLSRELSRRLDAQRQRRRELALILLDPIKLTEHLAGRDLADEHPARTVPEERLRKACEEGLHVLTEPDVEIVLTEDLNALQALRKACQAWWSDTGAPEPLSDDDRRALSEAHASIKKRDATYPAPKTR